MSENMEAIDLINPLSMVFLCQAINTVLKFLKVGGYCEAMLDVTKKSLLTFIHNCMYCFIGIEFFILSHPVTSKQPHKIVQIL